ncbi:MAG: type II secretion system protein GspE, partial [Gammaproteobacteria bacterium]|nr:type II secretion system protein GspE [Gammaproteobacteria bacterium]
MAEPEVVPLVDATQAAAPRSLPFGFAQQYGVLLDTAGGDTLVVHQGQPGLQVLSELRRLLGGPFRLEGVSEAEFQRRLTRAYQRDNNAAVQMAEDIGADVDLTRLADEIPDSGDLMDAEDDAPIIRLINAILSQAVRDKA